MSIAIIFNNKDPKPWQEALQHKLPDSSIEIYPAIRDKNAVRFALCWKPDKGVLAEFSNLQVVQSVGASIEHITTTQDLRNGVQLARMVDRQLTVDMFEFLLTAVMTSLKTFPHYRQQQSQQSWQPILYRSIKNTSITVLGLGAIGAHVASSFAALGFKVKGWSNSEKTLPKVESFVGQDQLPKALANSDFLINLLPSTPATQNILNQFCFQSLKKGAYLINVGRGEHLVENDLLEALASQQLSGALLDVFREEPLPPSHPFWKHPHITITPHIAAITNIETASDVVVQNFKNMLVNQPLKHIVDLGIGY